MGTDFKLAPPLCGHSGALFFRRDFTIFTIFFYHFLTTLWGFKGGFKGRICVNGTESASEKPLVKQCKSGAAAAVLKVIYKYINATT